MIMKRPCNSEPGEEMGSLKGLFKESAKELLKKSRSEDRREKSEGLEGDVVRV